MKANKIIMLTLIVLQSVLAIQLSSCQRMQKEEYAWIPTVGAPEEYPVRIISGEFTAVNGYSPQLPRSDFANSGWGNNGGVMAVGPDKKPVPDSLSVTWLSFAENKFFRGRFALPKDQLSSLLKTGYMNHNMNAQQGYDYFTLGFSPGGHIVLWLSGGPKQIEVASFTADEVKLDAQDLGPDDAYLLKPGFIKDTYERNVPESLRNGIVKNGIRVDIFKQWQKKYNWRYTVNSGAVKFYHLQPRYFNEESEEIFDAKLLNNPFQERAVPKSIYVVWFDKKKQKMSTEIVFDEEEIRSAFSLLPENSKGELSFEADPDKYIVAVSLKAGEKKIKLVKQKAKTSLIPG